MPSITGCSDKFLLALTEPSLCAYSYVLEILWLQRFVQQIKSSDPGNSNQIFNCKAVESASETHLLLKSNSFATVAASNQTIVYCVTKARSSLRKKNKINDLLFCLL